MPLKPIKFNSIKDIEEFAERLSNYSWMDVEQIYQQLIVDTKGNTYFLEDIQHLTNNEISNLQDIKFWCRTPETDRKNTAPKVISLSECKSLGSLAGMTFNKSLVNTLRPFLLKAQTKHWLEKLKSFHGEAFSDVIESKDFSNHWVKSIDGKLFYLPELINNIQQIDPKVCFKVKSLESTKITAKELAALSAESLSQLDFERDNQIAAAISLKYIKDNFLEKLKYYQVNPEASGLLRHLLKDKTGKTYLLEEILDKNSAIDESVVFELDFMARQWKTVRSLFNPSQGFNQKIETVKGGFVTRAYLDKHPETYIKYNPQEKDWSVKEIREIAANQIQYYYFVNYNKELVDVLKSSEVKDIQINYLPNDSITKARLLWPVIAYNSEVYDKNALLLSLRNVAAVPGSQTYLSHSEVADDIALQSLLKMAYTCNIKFAPAVDVDKEALKAALAFTKSSFKDVKDHNARAIEDNEKVLQAYRKKLGKPQLTIEELIKWKPKPKDNNKKTSAGEVITTVGFIIALVSLVLLGATVSVLMAYLALGGAGLGLLIVFIGTCCIGCSASSTGSNDSEVLIDPTSLKQQSLLLEQKKELEQNEIYLNDIENFVKSLSSDSDAEAQVDLSSQVPAGPQQYLPVTSASAHVLGRVNPQSSDTDFKPTDSPIAALTYG